MLTPNTVLFFLAIAIAFSLSFLPSHPQKHDEQQVQLGSYWGGRCWKECAHGSFCAEQMGGELRPNNVSPLFPFFARNTIHTCFFLLHNSEDRYRKQIALGRKEVMVEIFDTAGQEEYAALRDYHMKNGEGFLAVYSITSQHSFDTLGKIVSVVDHIKEDWPSVPIVVVGNKLDRATNRVVSYSSGSKFSRSVDATYFECSAKTQQNVEAAFVTLVKLVRQWRIDHPELVCPSPNRNRVCLLL